MTLTSFAKNVHVPVLTYLIVLSTFAVKFSTYSMNSYSEAFPHIEAPECKSDLALKC